MIRLRGVSAAESSKAVLRGGGGDAATPLSCTGMKPILPLLALSFFLAGCGAEQGVQPDEDAAAVSVVMDQKGFTPSNFEVPLGQSVCWINRENSDGRWPASNIHPTHEIYAEFDPKKPIPPGQTWCFTFDQEGIWRFHDHLFPEFTGVVRVEDEGN
jgi:plastocyanin